MNFLIHLCFPLICHKRHPFNIDVSIEHRNMYILNKLIIGLCYIPQRCPSPTHPSLPNFIQRWQGKN
ncbi:unnamed protein product [Urochloa humidicola]